MDGADLPADRSCSNAGVATKTLGSNGGIYLVGDADGLDIRAPHLEIEEGKAGCKRMCSQA